MYEKVCIKTVAQRAAVFPEKPVGVVKMTPHQGEGQGEGFLPSLFGTYFGEFPMVIVAPVLWATLVKRLSVGINHL